MMMISLSYVKKKNISHGEKESWKHIEIWQDVENQCNPGLIKHLYDFDSVSFVALVFPFWDANGNCLNAYRIFIG